MSDYGHIVHVCNKNTKLKTMSMHKEIQTKLTKNLLDIIILQLLETHPMHGYEIMSTIRKSYGVCLGASTIYPLLATMENKEYTKCSWNKDSERPRKVYELTSDGKDFLAYTAGSLRAICNSFGKDSVQTTQVHEIEFKVAPNLKREGLL
jgi:PadR family transcriptional regulator, regulatory protein PadR